MVLIITSPCFNCNNGDARCGGWNNKANFCTQVQVLLMQLGTFVACQYTDMECSPCSYSCQSDTSFLPNSQRTFLSVLPQSLISRYWCYAPGPNLNTQNLEFFPFSIPVASSKDRRKVAKIQGKQKQAVQQDSRVLRSNCGRKQMQHQKKSFGKNGNYIFCGKCCGLSKSFHHE
jgi:hypothetical protein